VLFRSVYLCSGVWGSAVPGSSTLASGQTGYSYGWVQVSGVNTGVRVGSTGAAFGDFCIPGTGTATGTTGAAYKSFVSAYLAATVVGTSAGTTLSLGLLRCPGVRVLAAPASTSASVTTGGIVVCEVMGFMGTP
jgi:hypothetical protein